MKNKKILSLCLTLLVYSSSHAMAFPLAAVSWCFEAPSYQKVLVGGVSSAALIAYGGHLIRKKINEENRKQFADLQAFCRVRHQELLTSLEEARKQEAKHHAENQMRFDQLRTGQGAHGLALDQIQRHQGEHGAALVEMAEGAEAERKLEAERYKKTQEALAQASEERAGISTQVAVAGQSVNKLSRKMVGLRSELAQNTTVVKGIAKEMLIIQQAAQEGNQSAQKAVTVTNDLLLRLGKLESASEAERKLAAERELKAEAARKSAEERAKRMEDRLDSLEGGMSRVEDGVTKLLVVASGLRVINPDPEKPLAPVRRKKRASSSSLQILGSSTGKVSLLDEILMGPLYGTGSSRIFSPLLLTNGSVQR